MLNLKIFKSRVPASANVQVHSSGAMASVLNRNAKIGN